jgi:RNA polymerase sigma-70 factor (ECF subfamily)
VDIREVVEEHERLVLGTAYRILGRWEDAQDAAQEVFLKLHRSRDRFDDGREVTPWLYRITVNTCRDLHRRRRPTEELVEAAADGLGPEDAAVFEEQRRMLHAALAKLPERERTAIVLREIEGLSTEEVAARMGSTVGTVRSQISTGQARLRRILAASIAASVGLLLWLFWPRPAAVPPPPVIKARMPQAPLEFSRSVRRVPPRIPRVKPEPLVVKLLSEDESIVIYWIVDAKGDEE